MKRPRGEGIAQRLLAFFAANPTEELTPHQIAVKYDCTLCDTYGALRYLKQRGHLIESVRVVRLAQRHWVGDRAPQQQQAA